MCTAVNLIGNHHFFGRNLDLDTDCGETVVSLSAGTILKLRNTADLKTLYSVIGTGITVEGFPLYFDAMNTAGLCGAALNFPNCAFYGKSSEKDITLCSFEVIPYVLSQCNSTDEAIKTLSKMNITGDNFNDTYQTTPLHFIFADKHQTLIVEPLKDGLSAKRTITGVITNSPEYDIQLKNMELFPESSPKNSDKEAHILASGTDTLPGALTSEGRFIRASYFVKNSLKGTANEERSDLFNILASVAVPKGSVITTGDKLHFTRYTVLYDTEDLMYIYMPYGSLYPQVVKLSSEAKQINISTTD